MLNKNSDIVKQQVIDNIIDLSKTEYALAHTTTAGHLCLDNLPKSEKVTLICGNGWYSDLAAVKRELTARIKGDADQLALCQKRLDTNEYTNTQGADGTVCTADWHRKRDKEILEEYTSQDSRWFIVYHDDKYLYDLETNTPIQVTQTPWITTDTTIFN
jgi:hypothetical protein